MCRDGLRSSPKVCAQMHKLPGLLRSPSRRKAAPTGSVAALKVMQAMEQLSCVACSGLIAGKPGSHRNYAVTLLVQGLRSS